MEYYKIWSEYKNNSQGLLISFDEEELGFDRYDVNLDKKLGVEKIYCSTLVDDLSGYDYIDNDLAWFVVSEKVKRIIESCNLGEYEFIPVINKKNEIAVGYLVHCMNLVDALDEENSVCFKSKWNANGIEDEIITVVKYAVKLSRLGDLDMFKLKKSNVSYFVSEKVKKAILDSKATGFAFTKIKAL